MSSAFVAILLIAMMCYSVLQPAAAASYYDVNVYNIRTYSTITNANVELRCRTSYSYTSAWIYLGKTNTISSSAKYRWYYNGVSGSYFRMTTSQSLSCQYRMRYGTYTYFTSPYYTLPMSNMLTMSGNYIWYKHTSYTQSGASYTFRMYFTLDNVGSGSQCGTSTYYSSSNCASNYCRGGRCCSSYTTATNCAQCSSSGSCSSCYTGYVPISGKCVKTLSSAGTSCTSNSQCSSNKCLSRCCTSSSTGGSGCSTCSSSGSCTACSSGYYISSGTCASKSSSGVSCRYHYHCLSGNCEERCCSSTVSSRCSQCSTTGSCTECESGYKLSGDSCLALLKSAGASCTSGSQCSSGSCLSGYCCAASQKVDANCLACTSGTGYCSLCSGSYTPNKYGVCTFTSTPEPSTAEPTTNAPPTSTPTPNDGGTSCNYNSQCSSYTCRNGYCCAHDYPSACSSCSSTYGYCNGCAAGYYLKGGVCEEPKSEGSSCTTNSECSSGSCSGGVCAKGSVTSSPGSNSNVQSAEDNEDDGDIVPGCNLWCLVGVIAAVLVVAGLIALGVTVHNCTKERPQKAVAVPPSQDHQGASGAHPATVQPASPAATLVAQPVSTQAGADMNTRAVVVSSQNEGPANLPYPQAPHTIPATTRAGGTDPFTGTTSNGTTELSPHIVPVRGQPHIERRASLLAPEVPIAPEPPTRCFKRAPQCTFAESIERLLAMPVPPNRPDCQSWVPDEDDAAELLHFVQRAVPEVKARPRVQALQAAIPDLSDDDLRMLIAYKAENPYPMYRWLNAWLTSSRRDPDVVSGVGPAFTRLYRALEKLPPVTAKASRAVIVHEIPALKATFENYNTRLASGMALNFWGFSSFSTDDEVMNSAAFMGKPQDEAIIYTCPELTGVDMEPFKPAGAPSEEEILPLAPAIFTVVSATKIHSKVTVVAMQQPNSHCAYVAPAGSKSFVSGNQSLVRQNSSFGSQHSFGVTTSSRRASVASGGSAGYTRGADEEEIMSSVEV